MLFHKVQCLEKERDPLEEQVQTLKGSVEGMYSELVNGLRDRQNLEAKVDDKTHREQFLRREILRCAQGAVLELTGLKK